MTSYADQMVGYVMENPEEATKGASDRKKTGETSATGYFIEYKDFNKSLNRWVGMQTIPTGLRKPTSKSGTMHLKNMSVFPNQFPPGELVTINDDGSFTVIATVRYEDASKEATQTYIVDHALTQYYDFEKNEFHATVPVTVHPGIPVDVTLITFTENDLNPLAAIDSATMMPLVRSGATVELTGVKFQVGLKIYTKSRTYNNVTKSETVFKDEFSLVVSKVATAPSAHHYCVDTLDIIKSTVNPDALVLYDIRDVLSRKARIPDTCWFYIPSDSMYRSPSGALTRLTGTRGPLAKANVLRDFDKDDKPTKVQYEITCFDIYDEPRRESFIVNLLAYEDSCAHTGLDTFDTDTWGDIMLSHRLTSYFLGKYSEKDTLAYSINDSHAVAQRDIAEAAGTKITHGTFKFIVNRWVVDWRKTLAEEAIEITSKCMLDVFREANIKLPSAEKKFKVATVDGKDELNFKSVLPYANPITGDGVHSSVINFGSGARPVFSCEDASSIIGSPSARFYALTGVSKANTEPWSGPEEGAAVFLRQLAQHGVKYQIFVVRNLEDKIKK